MENPLHAHAYSHDLFVIRGEGIVHLETADQRIKEGEVVSMGKTQGTPLLAAGRNGSASPAYGCVKPRLAFSLESHLDESGGQAREIKLKSFPSEAPRRFTEPDESHSFANDSDDLLQFLCIDYRVVDG